MDSLQEINSDNEAEMSDNSSDNSNATISQELNEEDSEIKENENENENEINNTNNENTGIDKIENNISEINNKNEENDSLLQNEINEININQESDKEKKEEESKKPEKIKEKKINIAKKTKKKRPNKTNINKNKENKDGITYSHNQYHNQNILNYIKQKELKEISECSFQPKINKKIGFEVTKLNNKEENKETETNKNKDVVERLLLWKERVRQKLLNNIKDKKNKEEIEREKCTFFPKLKAKIPKFDKKELNGNEKYYSRIKDSREIKKQKENKLNPNYDELYDKYYKNKDKTVLQKNKKVSKKTYQNYLNHFHNVLMNDDE